MSMKTVAIIAPDFCPSSMPPALRSRFFTDHLREFGWDPVVIATSPEFYEWSIDSENERLLRGDYEIIRTAALRASWTRKLGIGDLGLRSLWHNWGALSALVKRRKVDVLLITVPPFYPMLLGRLANMRFGLPYIIDFQDPYVTDYYKTVAPEQRPPKWRLARAIAGLIEPLSIRRAAHLVSVDSAYLRSMPERYAWISPTDITGIQLGVEPDDFDYLRAHPRSNSIFRRDDGLRHISYVGRGGPDMLPALRVLFRSVRHLADIEPELMRPVRFHFVGTNYATGSMVRELVMPLARELAVEHFVDEHPERVAYLEAVQILLDSAALLVPGSTSSHYSASKLFPYILANRPLLPIFHADSSVVRILKETRAGSAIVFSDAALIDEVQPEVENRLRELLSLPLDAQPSTDWKAFEPYTSRSVCAELARVLEQAILKGPRISTQARSTGRQ
jgi:hypothetical protein